MAYYFRKFGIRCPLCLDIRNIRWYEHIKEITIDGESICMKCRDKIRVKLDIDITNIEDYEWSDLISNN